MSATLLLRAAAAVACLQFVAHASLFLRSSPRHGPEEVAVVEAMKSHRFDFVGSSRSYWDFYFGYGLFAAFFCLLEAVLFWELAGFASSGPAFVKPVAALFLFANLAHVLLALRYFFITPVIPDVAIALCLGLALARLG
jgi:hypothetical protein